MRITPSKRKNASQETNHHILPKHTFNRGLAKKIGSNACFIVGVRRRDHDFLETTLEQPQPPHIEVLRFMEVHLDPWNEWDNDIERLEVVNDDLVGFAAHEPSPEIADTGLQIATTIGATIGMLEFFESLKGYDTILS